MSSIGTGIGRDGTATMNIVMLMNRTTERVWLGTQRGTMARGARTARASSAGADRSASDRSSRMKDAIPPVNGS